MSSTSAASKTIDLLRGRTIRSLAAMFRQPSLWKEGEPDEFEQILAQLGDSWRSAGEPLIEEWKRSVDEPGECEVEFARLFLGPFDIRVPSYASSYLEPEGQLMGEVASSVLELYFRAGLQLGEDVREMPDHVAVELDFIQYLMQAEGDLTAAEWEEIRTVFWSQHFALWFPRFLARINSESKHKFYRCLADFLLFSLKEPLRPSGQLLWK